MPFLEASVFDAVYCLSDSTTGSGVREEPDDHSIDGDREQIAWERSWTLCTAAFKAFTSINYMKGFKEMSFSKRSFVQHVEEIPGKKLKIEDFALEYSVDSTQILRNEFS